MLAVDDADPEDWFDGEGQVPPGRFDRLRFRLNEEIDTSGSFVHLDASQLAGRERKAQRSLDHRRTAHTDR